MPPQSGPLREVFLVYGAVALATGVVCRLPGAWVQQNLVPALLAVLFIAVAVCQAKHDPRGVSHYGIELGGVFGEPVHDKGFFEELWILAKHNLPKVIQTLGAALLIAAVVFPLFTLGFIEWFKPQQAFVFPKTSEMFSFGLSQLILIALPEEMFFRGYIQTRLTDAWPATRHVCGAELSIPAWLLQALLFALLHAVSMPQPHRLAVFFPGLLFGWARAYHRGIGVSIWLHAMSNVYSHLLAQGFYS